MDIRTILRKKEFPSCCWEALNFIREMCIKDLNKSGGNNGQEKVVQKVMDEFIFCLIDRRGMKRKPLTSIQALQLLEMMREYFSSTTSDVAHNMVFMTVFHPGGYGGGVQYKLSVLCRLVSMVLTTHDMPVLNCVGVWMQQLGSTSSYTLHLAKNVLESDLSGGFMSDLPEIVPLFTANMLTAAAELYRSMDPLPPVNVLELMTRWVISSPSLCLVPVTVQPALPQGSIVMPGITPFIGLIRLCVEMPLFLSSVDDAKRQTVYSRTLSKLHYGVLQSVLYLPKLGLGSRPIIASLRQITDQVAALLAIAHQKQLPESSIHLHTAVDRLVQLLQVIITVDGFHGNMADFSLQLKRLPSTRLVSILLNRYGSPP